MADPDNSDNIVSFPSGSRPDLEGLKFGGGGGNSGGMEARVARLEAQVDAIRDDIAEIKSSLKQISPDVAEMKGEMRHLISYKWMALYIAGLAALILRHEIIALFSSSG